jgi:hypothetical protein
MLSKLLMMCFIAHVLGDYYLQTERMAAAKKIGGRGVWLHTLVYGIPYFLIFIFYEFTARIAFAFIIIWLSHFLIDGIKYLYTRLANRMKDGELLKKEGLLYLADQALHIIAISVVCNLSHIYWLNPYAWTNKIYTFIHLSDTELFNWILLVLIMYKPVNITIHQLFSSFKPEDGKEVKEDISVIKLIAASVSPQDLYETVYESDTEKDAKKDKKAGAVIGFLERVFIIIFLSLQQFAAIGFVLTAKSIVRYDRITKDKEFAEYYLIGTLFSFISALVFYYLFFHGTLIIRM